MAGLDKRVASYEAALEGLTDGMTPVSYTHLTLPTSDLV